MKFKHNLFYSIVQPSLVPNDLYDNVYKLWKEKQPYKTYTTNYNIELLDNENKLSKLYDFFIDNVKNIYRKDVIEKRKYYACIFDKNFSNTIWHSHETTCDINGVYYLTKGCEIHLKDVDNNIIQYKPKQYELILFPNWVLHLPIYSNETRMSINVECHFASEKKNL